MARNDDQRDESDTVRERYTPDQNRTLSDAILESIERYLNDDVSKSEFVLYEDVNPDALDDLFRHDANPRTTVVFDTDDVQVQLQGDGGVWIEVSDRP